MRQARRTLVPQAYPHHVQWDDITLNEPIEPRWWRRGWRLNVSPAAAQRMPGTDLAELASAMIALGARRVGNAEFAWTGPGTAPNRVLEWMRKFGGLRELPR